jgi:hypothetical protein
MIAAPVAVAIGIGLSIAMIRVLYRMFRGMAK